jgi:hypothetical protein
MPRARFIQNMVVTAVRNPVKIRYNDPSNKVRQLLICLAASMSLFAMWIAVKARQNTTHVPKSKSGGPVPGAQVSGFNAAASANMGVWYFFWVWMANT